MLSSNLLKRFEGAKKDLTFVVNSPNFLVIKNNSALMESFSQACDLAVKWTGRVQPLFGALEDEPIQPLVLFMEDIVRIADRQQLRPGEAIPDALKRAISEFKPTLPVLIYGLLETSGIAGLSDEDFPKKRLAALEEIHTAGAQAHADFVSASVEMAAKFQEEVTEARTNIRKTVEDAEKDLELVKTQASRISVDSAQQQFKDAAHSLKTKFNVSASVTALLFIGLFGFLGRCLLSPPTLIRQIVDALKPGPNSAALPVSVPLFIVASAYYTSIRLAIIGILGVGLAFGLRMTKAYLHMIEHNQHKLRVTNSIEAFVAAVRTSEQKDLVLSKLVESVTEFGDSGILGKQGDTSSLPSVIFETMTKNISKSD
jgi:hypothetical protein